MPASATETVTIDALLDLAAGALAEAGDLFGLPPMVLQGPGEVATQQPGAYLWLSGVEHTYLIGVQVPDLAALGGAMGSDAHEAVESGRDAMSELLNVVAGVVKTSASIFDDSLELGMPVLAGGAIVPRAAAPGGTTAVCFGEIVMIVSLTQLGLSPEARRRRAEEAKNRRLQDELYLARKLEAVGQLAAGVAHEINTPLQYAGGVLEFLGEAFGDVGQLATSLQELEQQLAGQEPTQAAAGALRELVEEADLQYLRENVPDSLRVLRDGLEDVRKVVTALKDVGNASLTSRQQVDVNRLLQSTLIVSRSRYESVAELVQTYCEGALVTADPGQLGQVFILLIDNAADAIRTARANAPGAARGTIRVTTRCTDTAVEIEIADDGCGIPEHVKPRIFDPFFTTKEAGAGRGHGLCTVRSIVVEHHGGKIGFDSEAGAGARFVVTLPRN